MHIVAVPLARQRARARTFFTYVARASLAANETSSSQKSFLQRTIDRSSAFWVSLGRTDVSSTWNWRRRTFLLGERIMDRIGYEEWALKGVDQTLGPSIRKLLDAHVNKKEPEPVQLLYPSKLVSQSEVLDSLNALTERRTPHHHRSLVYNLIGIFITAPLFLVPVIPNLVSYYFMWRAWSHWRAYTASRNLQMLLQKQLIIAQADTILNMLMTAKSEVHPGAAWDVYLHDDQIEPLVKNFDLQMQGGIDLRRAQEQVSAMMKKGSRDPSS